MKNTPAEYLDKLRKIAEDGGGRLLSTEWLGNQVPHRFAFEDGREFEMQPSNLKRDGWPKDADAYLKTDEQRLAELSAIAEANGGKLLSEEWLGADAKHRFAFADGREFEMTPGHLKNPMAGWPKDADAYLKTDDDYLAELSAIAETGRGKLLSTEWLGAHAKHRFAFKDGREFEMRPNSLKKRGWPKDADAYFKLISERSKPPEEFLAELSAIAETGRGKLLSTEWLGNQTKHRFAFKDGREFEMRPDNLKSQGWPMDPDAYLKNDEQRLAEIRTIAEANGGKLLSTEWLGAGRKHCFAFEDGREFEMAPGALKRQGWPSGLGVSQERCHLAMEFIFGTKFVRNVRSVLPGGLELDGWNERLRVAFEYQGDPSHHEEEMDEGFTYLSRRDPADTQKKDVAKVKWCQENGVVLVVVDDLCGNGKSKKKVGWESQTVLRHVMDAVREAFEARGMEPPRFPEDAEEFTARVDRYDLRKLAELREVAEANGGLLKSEEYFGSGELHVFEFSDRREFEMKPNHLKSRGWPRNADAYLKKSATMKAALAKSHEELLDEISAIAEANDGMLLSTEWLGNQTKHRFAFKDGREFEMRPVNLKGKQGWPKNPDFVASRYAERQQMASEKPAVAKPAAIAPDIRSAHSDAFVPSGRPKPLFSTTVIPDLAERVKKFQSAQPPSPAKRRAPI